MRLVMTRMAGRRTRTVREKHSDTWGLSVCHSEVRFSRAAPSPPQIWAMALD